MQTVTVLCKKFKNRSITGSRLVAGRREALNIDSQIVTNVLAYKRRALAHVYYYTCAFTYRSHPNNRGYRESMLL